MTHICASKLTIIASDNGLPPSRRAKPLSEPMMEYCHFIWPLGTNFSEILIEIHSFSSKKMHLKMSSGKWRTFCLGLNVLRTLLFCITLLVNFYLIYTVTNYIIHIRHDFPTRINSTLVLKIKRYKFIAVKDTQGYDSCDHVKMISQNGHLPIITLSFVCGWGPSNVKVWFTCRIWLFFVTKLKNLKTSRRLLWPLMIFIGSDLAQP